MKKIIYNLLYYLSLCVIYLVLDYLISPVFGITFRSSKGVLDAIFVSLGFFLLGYALRFMKQL